jgi:glycosyltransferase involved in cell wall biosynthesis
LPVVSTLTGAIPHLVGREAGLLVPVDDVAALRAALSRVLTERALLAELAKGAAARRLRLRRWEQAGAQLAQLLARLDARAARC